ncbi:MAG: putative quinol monooxygenase [Pseudomonadales bacterium]
MAISVNTIATYFFATIAMTITGLAFAEPCAEVGYIATFEVKPGSERAFEAAITTVAAKVLEIESGTLFYAPYRGDSGKYFMMERYRDLAARDEHAKSEDVLALFPAVMSTLSAPIAVEPVVSVCAQAQQG